MEQRAERRKQRVMSREMEAERREQRGGSREESAERREQRTRTIRSCKGWWVMKSQG
jgi:hypothetical protein